MPSRTNGRPSYASSKLTASLSCKHSSDRQSVKRRIGGIERLVGKCSALPPTNSHLTLGNPLSLKRLRGELSLSRRNKKHSQKIEKEIQMGKNSWAFPPFIGIFSSRYEDFSMLSMWKRPSYLLEISNKRKFYFL